MSTCIAAVYYTSFLFFLYMVFKSIFRHKAVRISFYAVLKAIKDDRPVMFTGISPVKLPSLLKALTFPGSVSSLDFFVPQPFGIIPSAAVEKVGRVSPTNPREGL